MENKTESFSEELKSDTEMKTEPLETNNNAPFGEQKPDNACASTTDQKKYENADKYAQKRKQSSNVTELVSKKFRASVSYQANDDSFSDDEEYYLTISNVPKEFQITNYLQECPVLAITDELKNNKRQIQLTFETEVDRKKVLQKLNTDDLKGNIVQTKLIEAVTEPNDNASTTTEIVPLRSWRPSEDIWETDPLGLYGLRPEFLKSLDINPPLHRWVHVTNFRCDKFELRDVMELAGQVLSCSVINITKRFAKVQYSHPLEAVQAISMLNGQVYFGLKLKMFMEKNSKNDIILPKGLVNIGLGLGLQGRPLRDVVRQCERYACRQNSAINPILFRKNAFNDEDNIKDEEDFNKKDENEADFTQFMASTKTVEFVNERTSNVKHVEDLNSNDSESYERDSVKRMSSPESNSAVSLDSNFDPKDIEKPNNSQKIQVPTLPTLPQPGIPGQIPRFQPVQPNPVQTQKPNLPLGSEVNRLFNDPPGPYRDSAAATFANRIYPGPSNHMPNSMQNHMVPQQFRPSQQFGPPIQVPSRPMHDMGPMSASFAVPGICQRHMPRPGPVGPSGDKVVVKFANLPPSTTFPLLCEKLSRCGQVVSLHLTTPGCAVATFGHPSHAERCIQTYNGMTVEGYRIVAHL